MKTMTPPNSEILNWDPENMETYWKQCRQFDTSPLTCYEKNKANQTLGIKQKFTERLKQLLEIE
ncbi:MAG: hypothetical protein Q9M92_04525 [Enterobacterales bacterium]|nr:hypothetical protein [Enterobacterales bacterium]